ncbi:MAG: glycine/betaine ABC transporter permease [Clostridiaceae bacterium BRH_c20a]|nr:MAG: glycine/betaine ABC transporter permease [Clostridiaceae bacterium BRH_c20a]
MTEKREKTSVGAVFFISIAIIAAFVLWGSMKPDDLGTQASRALEFTIEKFGWFYLSTSFGFLIFVIYLAFSPFGKIKLGRDEEKPEFSDFTWISMLFSAGMGIGLVFWGVAEPLNHYINPPQGLTGGTPEAAALALRYSFFHWGLHPWAIYTLIALAIAYFNFRKGFSGLISSTFYPLIGDKVKGNIGKTIDILAVIATVFGVATSLGLGTLQINGGLNHLINIPVTITSQIIIIMVLTALFLLSATTGLEKGIKLLSNLNLLVASLLLLFTLFTGPTSFIFDSLTATLGTYLQNIVSMSLRLTPFTESKWVANWTLFYWAWWIAWAPFVGTFIARVSRGRTIREFVIGVLLIPSLFSFIWFATFGGTGLYLQLFKDVPLAQAVQEDITAALFITLTQLPLGNILVGIATILILTFFITSADSATFVLGMLTGKGTLHPASWLKIIWGLTQSAIAGVLLLSGGLTGLQTASIVTALPFAAIMVGMGVSLYRALKEEVDKEA